MIHFVVPGEPMGQPRHRSRVVEPKEGKPFVQNYTPTKATKRQRLVGLVASKEMVGREPMAGPIGCKIVCYFALPKSAERVRNPPEESWQSSKPDCDNLGKLILDACNGIVYRDDAQVSSLLIIKRRCAQGDEPRTEVRFEEMDDDR